MIIRILLGSQVMLFSALAYSDAISEMNQQNRIKLQEEINKQESYLKNKSDINSSSIINNTTLSKGDEFLMTLHRLVIDESDNFIGLDSSTFVDGYLGKKIGKEQIFNIIKNLENHLATRGYISTHVTITPSNLSNGVLNLKINWGKISKITVNGNAPKTLNEKMLAIQVLPNAKNKILNIHDIDQIVENGSNYNKAIAVDIIPDEMPDYSVINITIVNHNVDNYNLSLDNSGTGKSRKSGLYRYSASANFSDIILASDTISLSANTRHYKIDNDTYNYFWSGNYSFPIGTYLLSFGASNSSSGKIVETSNNEYNSDSDQKSMTASLIKTIYRAKQDKLSSSLEFIKRHGKNYFDNEIINISSKPYSDVSLGVQYITMLGGYLFYSDVKYNKGLSLIGGQKSGFDNKHPIFADRWISNLSLSKGFGFLDSDFNFSSRASMQYSKNSLIDIYRLGIGDEYSIRGYKQSIYGDSGFSITNTISTRLKSLEFIQVDPFIGFDFGRVYKNNDNNTSLAGAAIGAKAYWRSLSGGITFGVPVIYEKSSENIDPFTTYFNLSYSL